MNDSKKHIDPIPDEFASYEESAEFWDTHDTTDYPEAFKTVEVQAELRHRHYEVEIDENIIKVLRERSQKRGVPVKHLVSDILRQQIASAA
ncbi:MAG: CopG family antitoxin [bacterium]|nr:CopG family antitoxin [bacterium]